MNAVVSPGKVRLFISSTPAINPFEARLKLLINWTSARRTDCSNRVISKDVACAESFQALFWRTGGQISFGLEKGRGRDCSKHFVDEIDTDGVIYIPL